jgi:hypothetical protein
VAIDDDPDLDSLTRAQVAEVDERAYAVLSVLDDWLFTEHGVLSGSHSVGHFLDLLAAAGYRVEPIEAPALDELLPPATD